MINAERFKNEILEIAKEEPCDSDFGIYNSTGILVNCLIMYDCKLCKFDSNGCCGLMRTKWMLEEYKEPIELTKFEYDFLKNLNDEWHYIARSKLGNIILFVQKPKKYEEVWVDDFKMIALSNSIFNYDLFTFLTWEDEEPYNIQELLENCEVVDDD